MNSDTNCAVCMEEFTTSVRARICCQQCNLVVCRECVRTYLLNTTQQAHCMGPNCKSTWDREFLIENTLRSFVNGDYKKHREILLFEQEKARLPETMPAVENYLKIGDMKTTVKSESKELDLMWEQCHALKAKIRKDKANIKLFEKGITKEDKRIFKQKCGVSDCLGFLSSAWKCGLCATWTCPKCFEVLGKEKECGHECDPNNIESAKMIKKETRNCPACAIPIFKISGCFAKGTSVLLWNGKTKMVEDINIGDKLVGTDGSMRMVKDITNGDDKLYTVNQTKGKPYTVNSKHTLLLKPTYYKKILINETYIKVFWFNRTLMTFKSKKLYYTTDNYNEILTQANQIIENIDESAVRILVDKYLKLSDTIKKRLYGFKSKNICWKAQTVEIDPYILGSWLGDGYSDGSGISGNDTEVIQKWMEWAMANDGEIVHSNPYRFSVRRKGAGYKRGAIGSETDCPVCVKTKFSLCETNVNYESAVKPRNSTCPLKDILKKYNLLHNKHIPESYLMNERSIRLKLLAGIVDTDGCLTNDGKRITIIQVNKLLSEQICTLARSLGFVVNMRNIKKLNVKVPNSDNLKDYKDQCSINISGEHLSEIPTVISRKKCNDSKPNKDYFKTSIQVSFKEFGAYYGFMIDKDNEFILADFTSVKNCDQMWCTQCHIAFSWKTGSIVNSVIHNPHFYQWQKEGGDAIQTPGAQACGGLPTIWQFRRQLNRRLTGDPYKTNVTSNLIMNLHAGCAHFQYWELDRLRRNCQTASDNKPLRIKYLCKEITEKQFKQKIQQQDKMREKRLAQLQVYELLNTVFLENLNDIEQLMLTDCKRELITETCLKNLDTCHKVRVYANEQMARISCIYSQNVAMIDYEFKTSKHKYKKGYNIHDCFTTLK
jgi:hypothetical protein